MTLPPRTVQIAGLSFEATGFGEILTGVVGPQPSKECPTPEMPLAGLTLSDLPLGVWSNPEGDEPIFVLDEPLIYVGTTRDGLHSVLLGVKESDDGPTGLGLMRWTDEGTGATVNYHWPTRGDGPRFSWHVEEGNPPECVITWFPLPQQVAHVDSSIDGKTIADSVRPLSRVAVVPIPADGEYRLVDALAYDAAGTPLLRGRASAARRPPGP
jgi:hypothetical protein